MSPESTKGLASFVVANLKDVTLTPLNLEEKTLVNFKDAQLRDTHVTRSDIDCHIKQEHDKDFSQAKEVYLLLKNNFHSLGRYDDESWAFQKEKEMERKSFFRSKSCGKWLFSKLLNVLYGYGERPWRAIRTGFVVVFGLAFLYRIVGHIFPSPGLFNKVHMLIFWDSLYFSVVTFTTLGFGDWRPDPSHWIRYVVMVEAFIGAFLMALFIVTFARRMMR